MMSKQQSNNEPRSSGNGASQEDYREFVREFTRSARRIFSYILTLVGNYNDAEEVFQETSGTLWEKFSQGEFEQGTNFGAWACRVAYYKTLNYRTRRQAAPALFNDVLLDGLDQQLADRSEELDLRQRALADCCERLSEAERELVNRRYAEGASTAAIAETVGKSRISIYRALARIHERLLACITRTLADGGTP